MNSRFTTAALACLVLFVISACSIFSPSSGSDPTDAPVYRAPTQPPPPIDTPRPAVSEGGFCSGVNQDSGKCLDSKDTFSTTDKIYFGFHIANYPSGTSFRGEWFYNSGKEIYTYEMTSSGTRYLYFFVQTGSYWKESGGYMNLYVNGNLYQTYYFDIQ